MQNEYTDQKDPETAAADRREFLSGEDGLRELMDAYSAKLLRYCHGILCDYEEARDALQNTFVKVYFKRRALKKGTDITAFLYRVAYNNCIDIIRKRKRAKNAESVIQSAYEPESEYISEPVAAALESLTPVERGVVFGRAAEDRSYSELSAIYKKSEAALRKIYERAKIKLAVLLAEDFPEYAAEKKEGQAE